MRQPLKAALKHEVRRSLASPGVWLFVALGLASMAAAPFLIGGFFNQNRADLSLFFGFHPWIYLFLCPALVMGAWSEEWRQGTSETLLSLPIPAHDLHLSKFFAAWAVVALMLALSFPMLMAVAWLGEPDWGAAAAGYLGSWLFAGLMLGIGLLGSVISRSAIGGYTVAVVLGAFFYALGGGGPGSLLAEVMPMAENLSLLDPVARLNGFVQGYVDLRAVVFFVTLAGAFLAVGYAGLLRRLDRTGGGSVLAVTAVIVVGLNALLAPVQWRADLTAERLFTFDPGTRRVMEALPEKSLSLKLYWSDSQAELPADVRRHALATQDFLRRLKHLRPDISVSVVDPNDILETELEAQNAGLSPIVLPDGNSYYLGLVATLMGRERVLSQMSPDRALQMEYDVVRQIEKLLKLKRPELILITDLPFSNKPGEIPQFLKILSEDFDISRLVPGAAFIPDADVVLVMQSVVSEPNTAYALDQYVLRGGKVVLLLDPYLRTAPTKDYFQVDRFAEGPSLDHPADVLRAWGVDYNPALVLADTGRALPVWFEGEGMATAPTWVGFQPADMNRGLPFLRHLGTVQLVEPGVLTIGKTPEGVSATAVLTSSDAGRVIDRGELFTTPPAVLGSKLTGDAAPRVAAVLLEGDFTTAFPERPASVETWIANEKADPANGLAQHDWSHRVSAKGRGAVLAVADVDFVNDAFVLATKDMGRSDAVPMLNANLRFLANAVQYLTGESSLVGLRGRGETPRGFTRFEYRMAPLRAAYQTKERVILTQMATVKAELDRLQREVDAADTPPTDAQHAAYAANQRQYLLYQRELMDARRNVRAAIIREGKTLAAVTIGAIPLLICVLALLRRRRR